ncbi:uncharacterized protein N7479_009679 [Penicillium vulpinum]|uniref:uncharacterized protein n=1 Tax=Penicillium vulpinum TaxID=29845 RepID=UPI0025497661|nr:uncharacterized protein N7479_009679 [Penicillium vulpinum]KAJ5951266.1 hypothetical protein N7479_009679 [Penicillium vulpinum]
MKLTSILFVTHLASVFAQIDLYEYGINATALISDGCTSALRKELDCDPFLVTLSMSDYFGQVGNETFQDQLCDDGCGNALEAYHSSVKQQCAGDVEPWDGVPAVWAGDVLWSTWNRTCLKDPKTNTYCTDAIGDIQTVLGDIDTALSAVSKDQLCSTCVLDLIQQMQKTAYSNYDEQLVDEYVKIQDICNTGALPTEVQPPATNMTAIPGIDYSTPSNASCLSGNFYSAKSGDDMQSIAKAQKVPTGPLRTLNGIFPDGSNLLAGQNLCLPRACPVYLVQDGDTCNSIADSYDLTIADLISYNPSLNRACSNLNSGDNVCVAASGQTYTPTTIPGATATKTAQYASSTVAAAGPTGYGTTNECGGYYPAADGDNCEQISLIYSISLDLFLTINPSINAACSNLFPGLYYCVYPTANWNATTNGTTTSTYVTPPAPTPTGTTSDCYTWHTIVGGDTCSLLQNVYGITFAQLQTWNPQLDEKCSNLLLDAAYCVRGDTDTTTTSTTKTAGTTTSKTTTTTTTNQPTQTSIPAPGPTQDGVPKNCNSWVMQKEGKWSVIADWT